MRHAHAKSPNVPERVCLLRGISEGKGGYEIAAFVPQHPQNLGNKTFALSDSDVWHSASFWLRNR